MEQELKFDIRFKTPFTLICAGCSGCGKTFFVSTLLKRAKEFFTDSRCMQNVIYFYQEDQSQFKELKQMNLVQHWINEVPNKDVVLELTEPYIETGGSIVIIDDFGQHLNADIATFFQVYRQHRNTTFILLLQNLFPRISSAVDISRNSNYIVLFRNPRDKRQTSIFCNQVTGGNGKWLINSYNDATKSPFSHFLCDFTQECDDRIRYRANIFDEITAVYSEKNKLNK
jgi:hypothetical protein